MNSKPSASSSLKLTVSGMDCASCAKTIESAVSRMPGVTSCDVSFTAETVAISGQVDSQAVTQIIHDLGYRVIEPGGAVGEGEGEQNQAAPSSFLGFMWQRLETRLALIAAVFLLPGFVVTELLGRELIWINGLSLVALLLAGWPIARSAWSAVTIGREININVLMTVAAIGAVLIGAYVEAAMVMVLFAIGEGLEGYTAGRARSAIRALMSVAPPVAWQAQADQLVQVPVDDLVVGDVIIVKPGERIPMDGVVVSGRSAVNQAAITGESRPIDKQPADDLFAGTINGEGVLQVEVTRLAADNTISRMIALVEETQASQAPAQRLVDRFAALYTPLVMVLALLTAVIPPLLFGQPFLNPDAETFGWLYRGLALLVVACPCALVISTPVAIISAISNAAGRGILIKGGVHLEALSRVRAVAFDKTGTLTRGQPAVASVTAAACPAEGATVELVDCDACEELLALAGAVEAYSEHPLAQAVTQASASHQLHNRFQPAVDVEALAGRGVSGRVADRKVVLGSHRWFDEHVAHSDDACQAATAAAERGLTPIMVEVDERFAGTITVADQLRPESGAVVEELHQMGIQAIMLTGDEVGTAREIGRQVAIDDVRASLLPAEKLTAVQTLRQELGSVAMVGDGINDAPALAAADVGLAIGGAGATTQAMETADITLMDDVLQQLPFAIRLSRVTMQTIRHNMIFSIGLKLIFLLLVLVGWGTMWMAVVADVGTSLLVTIYSMRLLRFEPKP